MWYTWVSERIGLNALLFNESAVPDWLIVVEVALCIIVGYLCGSINSAIIVSKKLYGKDIRTFGSGNAGTTNMLRTFGKKAALFTLLGDMAKSALSVLLGALIFGGFKGTVWADGTEGAYLAGLFCVLGHIAPIFYRFKGGKGVLAAATMILMLDPIVFLLVIAVFVLTVALSKYVSMGSVAAAFLYPGFTIMVHQWNHHGFMPAIFKMAFTVIIALMVIFMHRENLARVYNGTESKLSFKKKPQDEDDEEEDD